MKILVVEDNPANRKLVCDLLQAKGYEVLSVDNAEEGITKARERRPDLILMDVQLPGMDGLTATRLLKADAATASIPVVALTAYAMKTDERMMLEGGCDGYIPKPIRYKQFLEQIQAFLPAAEGRKERD